MQGQSERGKRAALYARVSTEEQAQGDNIGGQVDAVKARVTYKGYEIVAEYLDDGVSGTRAFEQRPQGQLLVRDARKGLFDVIVVRDVSRLGRRSKLNLDFCEEVVKGLGIPVDSSEGVISEDSPYGLLFLQVLSWAGEWELESIKERSMSGKRYRAKDEGRWIGGTLPLGLRYYRPDKENGTKARFEIVDEEARVVQLVYGLYVHGDPTSGRRLGISSIAQKLTAQGVPTPSELRRSEKSGKRPKGQIKTVWADNSVNLLLMHPVYIGLLPLLRGDRRLKTRSGKKYSALPKIPVGALCRDSVASTARRYMEDERGWVTVEVPAIVDADTWYLAQRRLADNRRHPRLDYDRWILQGRIRCGECGQGFKARWDHNRYRRYSCRGRELGVHRDGSPRCTAPRLDANWLEREINIRLAELLRNPDAARKAVEDYLAQVNSKRGELVAGGMAVTHGRLEAVKEKIARLEHVYIERGSISSISEREFDRRMEALIAEGEEVKLSLGPYQEELRALETLSERVQAIREALESGRLLVLVDKDERVDISIWKDKEAMLDYAEWFGVEAVEASLAQEIEQEIAEKWPGLRRKLRPSVELRAEMAQRAELADEALVRSPGDTTRSPYQVGSVFKGGGLGKLVDLFQVRLRVHEHRVEIEGALPMRDIDLHTRSAIAPLPFTSSRSP
jgi:DNA invertase Pin-like site-specific DNA recombinase